MDKKNEKRYSLKEALQILKCKPRQIEYLFESGRLKYDDFEYFGGNRIYRESDIGKIKECLFRISNK